MIADYVSKHCQMKASVDGHEDRYHTLVTYDTDGVSGAAKTQAIFAGVKDLMQRKLITDIEVMTLNSVNALRKYIGLIDVNLCTHDEWQCFEFNFLSVFSAMEVYASTSWHEIFGVFLYRYTYLNSFTRYIQQRSSSKVASGDLRKVNITDNTEC